MTSERDPKLDALLDERFGGPGTWWSRVRGKRDHKRAAELDRARPTHVYDEEAVAYLKQQEEKQRRIQEEEARRCDE